MIHLKNVGRIYEGDTYRIAALENINLNVNEGEFISIMGRSGSGKTTLLNLIGFLDTPTDGQYSFDGKDVSNITVSKLWKYRRKNIGFVFQNFALIDTNTVYENVILPLQAVSMPHRQLKERAYEMLECVGISDIKNKYPSQISGGQKQRTAIARALANDPRIILADEPTGALDTETGDAIIELFRDINQKGKTIIIVTHDDKVAEKTRRRVRLEKGQIVEDVVKEA